MTPDTLAQLRALCELWEDPNSARPDYPYIEADVCRDCASELRAILDGAGEGEGPDCLKLAREAPDTSSAALWVIAERLGMIVDALPLPPGAGR